MKITLDVKYVGVNDYITDLFEGQYIVPNGMAYNSYVILDEKVVVMDTVDVRFYNEWLDNIENVLNGRKPDYLVVSHMEPDHSSSICNFMKIYPDSKIVANSKTFTMMNNFFGTDFDDRKVVVTEGDTLNLGKHVLNFVLAPMVHWPEVMMTYDSTDKILFSADGFGKFGAIGTDEEWDCEARRYYFGIVGKYGAQVKSVLKKAENLIIADIYAAREKDNGLVSAKQLSDSIPGSMFIADFVDIEKFIRENATEGDIVSTMGAGDVVNIGESLVK